MKMLSPLSVEWSWPRRNLSPVAVGDVFGDFDRLVESFLQPTFASTVGFEPSCDINETKDHYLVSFDMPGVKKSDIKIELKGNQLTISGERQREMKAESGEATLRHERTYGKFERTFTLPNSINAESIEAHYEDGVLNVALPKTELEKARTVQIQTGDGGFLGKLLGNKSENVKEVKESRGS